MRLWRWIRQHHLAILLTVVAIKQVWLMLFIPAWKVQDEPAHFQYAQTIVEDKKFPIFPTGTDYLSPEVLNSVYQVEKQLSVDYKVLHLTQGLAPYLNTPNGAGPPNYAAPYGPVYYLLESIPYAAFRSEPVETRLTAMRFFSGLWFMVTVWLAYRIVRRLRGTAGPAMTVATMVGFFPTLSFVSAGVNNDTFLLFLVTLTLDQVSGWWQGSPTRQKLVLTGIIAGLAAMTKQSGWVAVGIVAYALFMLERHQPWRKRIVHMLWLAVPAMVVGISWMIRTWLTGAGDFISHEVLVRNALSPQLTPFWILMSDLFIRPVRIWGTALGWFGRVDNSMMVAFGLAALLAGAALVGLWQIFRAKIPRTVWHKFLGVGIFGWLALEGFYQLLFWQRALAYRIINFPVQGRYYFLLIVPIFALLLAGLEQLVGQKYQRWVWFGLGGLMVGLTLWSFPILWADYSHVR